MPALHRLLARVRGETRALHGRAEGKEEDQPDRPELHQVAAHPPHHNHQRAQVFVHREEMQHAEPHEEEGDGIAQLVHSLLHRRRARLNVGGVVLVFDEEARPEAQRRHEAAQVPGSGPVVEGPVDAALHELGDGGGEQKCRQHVLCTRLALVRIEEHVGEQNVDHELDQRVRHVDRARRRAEELVAVPHRLQLLLPVRLDGPPQLPHPHFHGLAKHIEPLQLAPEHVAHATRPCVHLPRLPVAAFRDLHFL
mmetsp:Transcript_67941/g.141652  ORF Transcript_67941/g.141652 Transcript_67941/m.141652 type:complete len:252 (-) Transcript_67941:104-859(-)